MELKDLLNTPIDNLEHHGVKGMKWGVKRKERRLAKKDAKWEKKINKGLEKGNNGLLKKAYNTSIPIQNAMLDSLNKKYPKANSKYFKEYHENMTGILNSTLNSIPEATSPSGKKKARLFIEKNKEGYVSKLKVTDE